MRPITILALITITLCGVAFAFIGLVPSIWAAAVGFAGIAIGLTLTAVHLVGIPLTGTSVNPARRTGPAIFVGGWAISQLWLFWVAPILGALLAGVVYSWMVGDDEKSEPAAEKEEAAEESA